MGEEVGEGEGVMPPASKDLVSRTLPPPGSNLAPEEP